MARPDQQPEAVQSSEHSESPHNEDQSQVEMVTQSESQSQPTQTPVSTVQLLPVASLAVRLATWICLLVSLIILASNSVTIRGYSRDVKFGFSNIYTYRYMMSAIVIGFAYTCVQVPFEIYQLIMVKRLVTHNGLIWLIFYADKILLSLLATGVGAAFGATYDLKKNLDELDDQLESVGDFAFSQIRSKLDNFFNMAYVSAGFLLIAFLCSLASSILSSLPLQNK